ncbi:MAG: hypothetical protein Q7R87_02325 [Nanoarchaeota archaeon]|nr:hypothetical protein [Nanoarchaeota archaeon]
MRIKILLLIFLFGLVFTSMVGLVYAQSTGFYGGVGSSSFVNQQLSRPSFQTYYGEDNRLGTYWPILNDKASCEGREDFILQVSPGGCQPAVVRSDLLEDQNVPVFCQVDALQINPLIDVKEIRNIRFSGKYPDNVAGVGFHPAKAALRTNDILLGSPVINNIGYVVVVLKRVQNESSIKDVVNMNLTAQLDYQAGNAYGIGKSEYYLEPSDDKTWSENRYKQGFFQGQYFVRLDDVDSNFAQVSLYKGDVRITSTKVQLGKESADIFLPGFYCGAGLKVAYDGFVAKQDKARIEIRDERGVDSFDAYRGSTFLDGNCRVDNLNVNGNDGSTGILEASCYGKRFVLSLGVKNSSVNRSGESLLNDEKVSPEIAEYLSNTLKTYENVADDYPQETKKDSSGVRTYGEAALTQAIQIANDNSQFQTEVRLRNKFIELYPNSLEVDSYKKIVQDRLNFDYVDAVKVIDVGSRPRTVSLIRFEKVQSKESKAKAVFLIGGSQRTLRLGEEIKEGDKIVRLVYIDSSNARVECVDEKNRQRSTPLSLRIGQNGNLCGDAGNKITLLEVQDVDRVARIRLIPHAKNPTTQTNLSVSIGIEKRAIQLSPEKTELKIKNLNKSIENWEKISKSLGKVVTGLKTACFATAGVLTIKNLLDGVGGEALARQQTMTGPGGWTEKCGQMVAQKEKGYTSMTQCYNGEADKINADVKTRTEALTKVNENIAQVEKDPSIVTKGVLESTVNVDKAKLAYAQKLKNQGLDVPTDEKTLKYITYSDLRELEYNSILKSKGLSVNQDKVNSDYDLIAKKIKASQELSLLSSQSQLISNSLTGDNAAKIGDLPNANVARTTVHTLSGDKVQNKQIQKSSYTLPPDSNSVSFLTGSKAVYDKKGNPESYTAPQQFMVVGRLGANGVLQGQQVYQIREEKNEIYLINIPSEAGVNGNNVNAFLASYKVSQIKDVGAQKYGNPIISANQEVRFFGSGTYDGFPSTVPFDIKEGWYVNVKPTLGVGNQQVNYDKSGAPRVFDICNVGDDSTIDSKDECQTIHVGVNDNEPVLGLAADKSRTLISKAKQALIEAASQRGSSVVSVAGQKLRVGERMAAVSGMQCQDFMKPEDCKILFNMCDPVICPASRCNFGGKYQVDDVIQTGIVGGALLCLPNAQEGIIAPVCLSGIQAGVDGYLSVMKSYRSCLQENLKTGKLIGVCDQIHSIYMCDFFWRQFSPLANVLVPKVVESLYSGKVGGEVRNGGEYLTTKTAFDNTKKSVDYFTQSYAVNSLKAFQARSSVEVGALVCKSFVSSQSPKSFKNLVEPDSPPQFFAQFDSIRFTDTTIPPTAQYKVFYHIFAGKDRGVQYNIYLKSPPTSSEYFANPTIQVESGFIGLGQTVDKAKDFTAPEGYKELCVRINDREYCGFKQVTTDFGLNYLKDEYVKDQLQNTNIQNAEECIYGTPDLKGALANTNPQFAGEEAGLPQIYKRGIVRICASSNPGASTNSERYQAVGKCDDNKQCWLDKQSVNNALIDTNAVKNIGARNETLDKLSKEQIANLGSQNSQLIVDKDKFGLLELKSKDIRASIDRLTGPRGIQLDSQVKNIIAEINNFTLRLFYNEHKAEFLYLKAEVYGKALSIVNPKKVSSEPSTTNVPSTTSTSASGNNQIVNAPVVEDKLSFKDDFSLSGGKSYQVYLNDEIVEGVLINNQGVSFNGENVGSFTVSGNSLIINLDNVLVVSLGLDQKIEQLLEGATINVGSKEIVKK